MEVDWRLMVCIGGKDSDWKSPQTATVEKETRTPNRFFSFTTLNTTRHFPAHGYVDAFSDLVFLLGSWATFSKKHKLHCEWGLIFLYYNETLRPVEWKLWALEMIKEFFLFLFFFFVFYVSTSSTQLNICCILAHKTMGFHFYEIFH